MSNARTRSAVLRVAEDWLDTPYRHQASLQGVGTDCLGLIRGIWRTLYGAEPERPPAYTPDWAERLGAETLLHAAQRSLRSIDVPQPGDVLLFRMRSDAPCKHIGVLADPTHLIHAYWGKAVVRSALVPFWRRRHVASFAFPPL